MWSGYFLLFMLGFLLGVFVTCRLLAQQTGDTMGLLLRIQRVLDGYCEGLHGTGKPQPGHELKCDLARMSDEIELVVRPQ